MSILALAVKKIGQGLHSVDQTRTWPYHQPVCIDRPDFAVARQVLEHLYCMGCRAVEVEPARRDHHHLGRHSRHFIPRGGHRTRAGSSEHCLTTGPLDQFGDPVTCDERGIGPLEHEHTPAYTVGGPNSGHASRHCAESLAKLGNQLGCPISGTDCGTHCCDGVEHLVDGVRIEREYVGATAQALDGGVDVAARERTDPAQVLCENHLGIDLAKRVLIEGVQQVAGRDLCADQGVDRRGIEAVRVEATDEHTSTHPRIGRKVTLEGHSHQLLGDPEREHDLGGGRNQ